MTSRILHSLVVAVQESSGVGAVSIWRVDRSQQRCHRVASSTALCGGAVCLPRPEFWECWRSDEQIFSLPLDVVSGDKRQGFLLGVPIISQPPFIYLFVCYQATRPVETWRIKRVRPFADVPKTVIQSQTRWSGSVVKSRRTRFGTWWQAEEDVRQQIASVLHGPIQTKLLLLEKQVHDIREQYNTALGPATAALAKIEESLEHLRDDDIRRLSHRLYPDLIQVSLAAALRALKQDFERLTQVDLWLSKTFVELDSVIDNQIPQETRLGIYRIVEEAFNNAVRHGHAQHVRVTVDYCIDATLKIDIVDDGSGFNNSACAAGFGMRMMKRWARRLGGIITFLPHAGAHVQLQVPLRRTLLAQSASR